MKSRRLDKHPGFFFCTKEEEQQFILQQQFTKTFQECKAQRKPE